MSEELKTEAKTEKKPMKKGGKIFIGILVAAALIVASVLFVKFYFDKENSKPVFELPVIEERQSAFELPKTKEAAYTYVSDLLADALNANDVELSWSTGVDLSGDMEMPFSKEDSDIILFIRDRAAGQIAQLYPSASTQIAANAEQKPSLDFNLDDIAEFSSSRGRENENGEAIDDDYYFIDFTLNNSAVDSKALKNGEIAKGIVKILAPAMNINGLEIEAESINLSFRIDRVSNQLLNVDIRRSYSINASVELLGEYASLIDGGAANIKLPYTANESISFRHYGVRFLQQQYVAQPDDMEALPVSVTINDEATANDYSIRYEISKSDSLEIDDDAVMTVLKAYEEEPVEVKMILEYNGHTYSDAIYVYTTEKEVKTDE